MDWYVLQTRTGAERETRDKLLREGLDARVPTELRPIHRRGAWTQREYTLLPGYVFLGMEFAPALYQRLRAALGAARLLGMESEAPTPITADEVVLWGLCGPDAPLPPSVILFDAHGTARVVSGPLMEFAHAGRLVRIDRHARRAVVAVRLPDGSTRKTRFGIIVAECSKP